MGLFNKLKRLMAPQEEKPEENETNKNIYEELGVVKPFTVLADKQFNRFIGALSENKHGILNETEKEAFECLWYAAAIDIDGTGNNIWNLKKGAFDIYNEDNVIIRYEKKSAEVKDKYSSDNARANFVYSSSDGSFVINQNDRNRKVFLVYVSEDITDRMLRVLSEAEIEALDLEPGSIQEKNNIETNTNIHSLENKTTPSIQEKYKINDTLNKSKTIINNVSNRDDGGR